jgi:hypothetical protein
MDTFCCEIMKRNLVNCEGGLVHVPKYREFGIVVLDGGPSASLSYIVIEFCPWCGQKLPSSLRDEWFSQIEALNLEPDDPKIPAKFMTGAWWENQI